MSKYALKLTWVLLLFGLLCPVEILGQNASPYLNPLGSQINPAAIVWREKSIVGVNTDTYIVEKNSPMTQRTTAITNKLILANMGDFFGIKSGFEFFVGDSKNTKEFLDEDTTQSDYFEAFDKTGGFAIGPLAIGYTDASEVRYKMLIRNKDTYEMTELTQDNTHKSNRKGLSLKLSNLFVGIHQVSTEHKDTKFVMKRTNLSDSSVTNYSSIQTDYTVNDNTVGIGIILGKENENRYRLEIYNTHRPKVQYSETMTKLSDGRVWNFIYTVNEKKTNGVVLETKMNNYYFSLEYTKSESSDAGTNSGKVYSNTTGQEIAGSLGLPLGESFQFNIALKQGLSTQPYTASPDEYKSYEVEKKYDLTLAYLY